MRQLRKLLDLARLIRAVPQGWPVFLRQEFDRRGRMMRRLARVYRRTLLRRTRVVAVVGSLGKTTATRAVSAALGCPDRHFSFSNYGASLSFNLLRVRPRDRHAVLEAGVAGPGAMASYARTLRPDIVVATSIRSDHNRSFPTLFDTRAEKVKMVSALSEKGLAVLNGDDEHVRWMASQTRARVVTFGLSDDNDVRATDLRPSPSGMTFTAILHAGRVEVKTRFLGEHMVYPFLAALAVADHEGVPLDVAAARLAEVVPADSRMEIVHLPGEIAILDDSCKSSLASVHAAIDALAAMPARRKVVFFGGVEEPPGRKGDINREIGRRLGQAADLVICQGDKSMSAVRSGAMSVGMPREAVRIVGTDFRSAMEHLERELRPDDAVLLKGHGTQALRRIVLRLQGRQVSCAVNYCAVKVRSCDVCPLLGAPHEVFLNPFILRSVRF